MYKTVTALPTPSAELAAAARRRASRRLRPLYVASLLGGLALWVPVEKLFMAEIGFDPASVGVMAAAYATVVPLLEVPSGILADRWSRKGVLMIAYGAVFVSVLVCGLAGSVLAYVIGAAFLGVYLALQSGTLDSMVYDLVREELGEDSLFEASIGRFRAVEGAALAASAVGGGLLAMATSPRVTYFATLPLLAVSIAVMGRFREPSLHGAGERQPLRQHVAVTARTVVERGPLRPIVVSMVLTSLLVHVMLEFGPLWLLAIAAPTFLYGAQWAGLTGALGIGGLLAARLHVGCRRTLVGLGAVLVSAAVAMATIGSVAVIITAQIALVLVLMVLNIHLTALLHAAIPSSIRAGVSSGVSTLTWLTFVPFGLTFGVVADRVGAVRASWLVVAVAVATAAGSMRLVQPPAQCAGDVTEWADEGAAALAA